MLKEYDCLTLHGEDQEVLKCKVVEEEPLSIFINGRHFVTAMISPAMKREFVTGHLFSEKIVENFEEIESLDVEGNIARVIITNPIRTILPRRPIVSGCGGVASFLDESKIPKIRSDLKIKKEIIFSCIKSISESKIHQLTGGVHSVGLFQEGKPICMIEDIGRHNALDKAIGRGLEIIGDFGQTLVASTGRISSDMALKCSVAGIPIVASRGATTSLAIAIAERTGLTIIGFVRGNRMNVYTNSMRLDAPAEIEDCNL